MRLSPSILIACAATSVACTAPDAVAQSTVPTIWGFQVPLGAAASDSRFTKMVRLYANQTGSSAGAQAASISQGVPAGKVCILVQNFGNETLNQLCQHPDDALENPLYSVEAGNPDISKYTIWTAAGRAQCSNWMSSFLSAYLANNGRAVSRFHFDIENLLAGCCSRDWLLLFDAQQSDTGHAPNRFTNEVIPGFAGETLSQLYNKSNQWENPSASPAAALPYNSSQWMGGTSDNVVFSRWLVPMGYQALDGALVDATSSQIKAQWSTCKLSNYESSCRFDGVNGRVYTHPYQAGAPGYIFGAGLRYKGACDLQAPFFYPASISHQTGSETVWDASMRVNGKNLDAMIHSFSGNHQGEITPWVSVVNQKFSTGNTTYAVTENDTRRQLAILRSRDIPEFIAFNNDVGSTPLDRDCNDTRAWNLFVRAVDSVWGTTISSTAVNFGTTGQSPQTPITFGLADPLSVTSDYRSKSGLYEVEVEATYSSAFAYTPCKLASVLEGTTSGGTVTIAVAFYNHSTALWDSATQNTGAGYIGIPNQTWWTISATNHIGTNSTKDIKVKVTYTSPTTFTVALDCAQSIGWQVAYLTGDADGDGDVDTADVAIASTTRTTTCKWTHGDVDGDADVDAADLSIVTSNLGSTNFQCP